ncbi:MAG TPA: YciI family protein [Agromyces sp.]|nr:YciI family protein [Agromyces sp.]
MRYTMLLHYAEESPETMGDDVIAEGMRRMSSFAATLQAAGVLIAAEVLQPSDVATTLRRADGTVQVQDGPFADTKEQLGGTIVVDVPDLDAALEWASQAPVLEWGGAVEIRPGATHTVDGVWTPNG